MKRLFAAAAEGCSGHGPAHLLVESAAEIGFSWCSQVLGWIRPGLLVLSMVAGPIQHFRSAVLDAWRHWVSMGLCSRKGFRGGPFLDVSGTMQLLNSDHVRERDKALLRGVLVGGVWNGFLLGGKVKGCHVPFRFSGGDDNDGHLFWDCTFPPLVEISENPEFHELMEMDKSCLLGCLLWHGWLPMLSGVSRGSPWALNHAEGASNLHESALGSYTSAFLLDWHLPGGFMLSLLLFMLLGSLMFGLMGVWLRIRFLVLLLLVLGFLLVVLAAFGLSVLGGTLMMIYRGIELFLLVVLFLVPYSLSRGLSFGVSFLLCRPLVVCIWVLII